MDATDTESTDAVPSRICVTRPLICHTSLFNSHRKIKNNFLEKCQEPNFKRRVKKRMERLKNNCSFHLNVKRP